MKTLTAVLSLLMLSSIASAQSPDPSKWMCRNLADSGGLVYQGESVFGTQACRPVPQATIAPSAPAAAHNAATKRDAPDTSTTASPAIAAPLLL